MTPKPNPNAVTDAPVLTCLRTFPRFLLNTKFVVAIATLYLIKGEFHPHIQTSPFSNEISSSLATKESNGFFTDVADDTWELLKRKAHDMQPNTHNPTRSNPKAFFQENYEPEFVCQNERRVGRLGDGGKWICDPHRIITGTHNIECLVYSIGSNGDASFEAGVLQDVSSDCEIHVFDFGTYANAVAKQTGYNSNVHYHQWGISNETDGQYKTLHDTVAELGHIGRTIDVFKIDCEGCETETYKSWLEAPVKLRQILVEIHPQMSKRKDRVEMKLPVTVELFQALHHAGYVITHKEPNIQYQQFGLCVEYNFLLLTPGFWGYEGF